MTGRSRDRRRPARPLVLVALVGTLAVGFYDPSALGLVVLLALVVTIVGIVLVVIGRMGVGLIALGVGVSM